MTRRSLFLGVGALLCKQFVPPLNAQTQLRLPELEYEFSADIFNFRNHWNHWTDLLKKGFNDRKIGLKVRSAWKKMDKWLPFE